MHQKRTKKNSFWLHEEWLSPQRAIILFLSESHLSRKERHLYFLPCQMHQKRTKKIVPFDYMMLTNNVICTFCLAKCIRKGQKIVPFDYMKNGSHHREQLFCSFLKVIFLEKNVICTFCLAKCIRKGQKNCSFWLHDVNK